VMVEKQAPSELYMRQPLLEQWFEYAMGMSPREVIASTLHHLCMLAAKQSKQPPKEIWDQLPLKFKEKYSSALQAFGMQSI